MTTAPPIKFRCFQCNKLLGVSRSKANSVVTCPQCATQLVVPEVDEPSPSSEAPAPKPAPRSASGSQIEPVVVLWDRNPEPEPPAAPDEGGFPAIQIEPVSLRPDPPARLRTPTRPRSETWPETIETPVAVPQVPAEPIPAPRPEPAQPVAIDTIVKVEPPSIREDSASPSLAPTLREPSARRNDVVLPRTAVVLWSFLVLVGIVLAFTTGLLVGRFLWAPGVPVESAMVRPQAEKPPG